MSAPEFLDAADLELLDEAQWQLEGERERKSRYELFDAVDILRGEADCWVSLYLQGKDTNEALTDVMKAASALSDLLGGAT